MLEKILDLGKTGELKREIENLRQDNATQLKQINSARNESSKLKQSNDDLNKQNSELRNDILLLTAKIKDLTDFKDAALEKVRELNVLFGDVDNSFGNK